MDWFNQYLFNYLIYFDIRYWLLYIWSLEGFSYECDTIITVNLGLYSVAAFLIVMLFLPIGQWFDIVNVNFKLTFFIIPFFGLASLPTAIYNKNIRKILLSTFLVVLYFILFSLVTALSGLFQLDLYPLLYK